MDEQNQFSKQSRRLEARISLLTVIGLAVMVVFAYIQMALINSYDQALTLSGITKSTLTLYHPSLAVLLVAAWALGINIRICWKLWTKPKDSKVISPSETKTA